MRLKELKLKNFTNYFDLNIDLGNNLNILVGNNAQGKSNLVDAIYYLSSGASNRNHKDSSLINWERDFFAIEADLENRYSNYNLKISYQNGKKQILLNNNKINKIAEIIGYLNVVIFSPDDLFIVKGNPYLRRDFLDQEIIQVSPQYYHNLQKYKRIIYQRNNLLKKMRFQKDNLNLDVWDVQLIECGSWLIYKRLEMLRKLRPLARLTHRKLTQGKEELDIEYKCSIAEINGDKDIDFIKEKFAEKIAEVRNLEIEKACTQIGPQRDDFNLKINGINVRSFGSQGQQRTAALSLKIAELEFIYAERGEYPVLLLDDVLSELDQDRKNQLIDLVRKNIQTFITCTDLSHLNGELLGKAKIYRVFQGKLTAVSIDSSSYSDEV